MLGESTEATCMFQDSPHTPDDAFRKSSYGQSRDKIKAVVSQVEALQIELLVKVRNSQHSCDHFAAKHLGVEFSPNRGD